MTQEEAKTLAEKEYPNGTFGAEMCRQAYIKGLLQSPSGKCREALQRIIDLYPSSHEHGMANIALNDIRQTAIDALTLDSREDQDELWGELYADLVNDFSFNGHSTEAAQMVINAIKSKFIISKKYKYGKDYIIT